MSRNIDLSGLKNVRDKLQRLKAITNDDIVMAIAERGKELAQEKYSGDIVVTTENIGNGRAKVIASGDGADEIQKVALSEGMTTLRIGAAKLVLQGVTSIAEVERIATE